MGIAIRASATLSTSRGKPAPSLPINIAEGPVMSHFAGLDASSPRALAAYIFTCAIFNCASSTGMAIPRNIGSLKDDPADALSAFGDHGSAVPSVATAPVAPNASADRIIV